MRKEIKNLVRFDWAMKYLLRNKANFGILEGFLSELLGVDVIIENLLESESNPETVDDKMSRVDLKAKLKGGEQVIIEVQCIRQWDFLSRMLHGVSKVVIEHLKSGDTYGKIPRVLSINIVYFDLGQGEDYIYRGRTEFEGIHRHDKLILGSKEKAMYPETVQGVSDIFPEYYVLKVTQFNTKVQNKLDEWMYFFKNSAIQTQFKAKGIQEAADTLSVLQLSDKKRQGYDRFMDNVRDETSLIQTHYQDGLSKGEERGKTEAESHFVVKMDKNGLSLKQISDITGLSFSRIQEILKK